MTTTVIRCVDARYTGIRTKYRHIKSNRIGGAENAGVENAGVENAGVHKVWKAVRIKYSHVSAN